jgi:hypothetical protein
MFATIDGDAASVTLARSLQGYSILYFPTDPGAWILTWPVPSKTRAEAELQPEAELQRHMVHSTAPIRNL